MTTKTKTNPMGKEIRDKFGPTATVTGAEFYASLKVGDLWTLTVTVDDTEFTFPAIVFGVVPSTGCLNVRTYDDWQAGYTWEDDLDILMPIQRHYPGGDVDHRAWINPSRPRGSDYAMFDVDGGLYQQVAAIKESKAKAIV